MKKYITLQGEEAIRNFKYNGGSIAYSYLYLWSPLAQYCLKFTPKSWAPNTITVLGTIIHIIGNLLLIFQNSNERIIPWTYLLFGAFIFIYQTLDNIDGKQARKTGNSSPLGMCMDHGCDALGVSFLTLGVSKLISMENIPFILITGQIAIQGSFWMATWAQYHSKGILILGKFNAVDDGIPTLAFLGIFTYFAGQDFWTQQIIPGWQRSYILAIFIWVAGVFQIWNFIFNSGENFTKDLKKAIWDLFHFLPLAGSLAIIIYFTDWQNKYFFAIYFSSVIPVVRDTSYMHICVVAQQKYNQFQFATILFSIAPPVYIAIQQLLGITIIPQNIFVYLLASIILLNYTDYVISVSNQMADVLKIKIFRIKKKSNQ